MAIDLGRWFRDRKRQVEGVAAQVNPFDNGKTYSSVVQNTPVQTSTQVNQRSAQPPSNRTSNLINPQKPTWLDNQAFTVSSRPIAQPNFQAPKPNGSLQQEIDKSYGRGLSSLKNRLRDVVDSNTQADRIRRVAQTGLDESYQDQQARLTRDAMSRKDGDNIGAQTSGAFFKEGASFVGKSPSSIAQIQARVASSNNPLVRYGVGAVVPGAQYGLLPGGNKRGEQILRASQGINTTIDNKLQQSGLGDRADHNKWARGAGSVGFQLPALLATGPLGLAGMGSQTAADEANKAEMAGRTNEQALGIGLLQGGASMASEKFGLDRFLPGNGTAATSIKPFLGNMAKRIGTEGAQEAQQQFTQNLISNKTYNPNQGLKEGVFESAVLGGLSGGAMSGAIDLPNVTRNTNIKLSPLDESGFIDVPKQDLIIRNGEGKAMSVEKDPLEALKAEARKYKGAEEFVNATKSMKVGDGGIPISVANELYRGIDGTEAGVTKRLTDLYNQAHAEANTNSSNMSDRLSESTDPADIEMRRSLSGKNRPKGAFEIEQNKPQGRVVAPKTKPDVRNTKFATKTVQRSPEVSDAVKKGVKEADNSYELVHNKDQVARSEKFIKKNNIRNAVADVKERLNAKDFDDQAVSDAIAVAKKLDAKGGKANLAESTEIYEQLSKKLTKAGQTVQAASLLSNRTPQGLYHGALKTLRKAGVTVDESIQSTLQTKLADVKATKAGTPEGDLARFKFIEQVNKLTPASATSKGVQLWKAGLLTAPTTTAGNLTANTLEQGLKRGYEDPIATGADILMSVFTGKRSKTLTGRGVLSGAKEGAVKGVSYFKTGFDPRNPNSKFDIKEVHYSDSPLGKAAEAYTQSVFKLMGSQDQPFYYASLRNSLYDQAITEAKNQGLKGSGRSEFIKKFITEPSKKSMQLADTEARYDVFQNKTALGEAASGVKGKTGAVGDFFIPFSGVPSSIATRIVERTPLGTATEVVKQMRSGTFNQRKMAQALARGTTGVVLVGVGKALAEAPDLLTLGFPKDDKERKLWELEGKQPYSIKIGGKWRSLNYFQPAGTLIAAGGEYARAKKEGASETEAWSRAVSSAGKALTEQSFLKGVSGVLNAVNDPARFGEKFVEQTAGSAVPNIIRSGARSIDNKQRQVNGVIDSVKAGIPGLQTTLAPKVDEFGNDISRRSSAINSFINPSRPSDAKNVDDTTKEIRRLQDVGQGVMTPNFAKDALGGDTKLNEKQITELQKKIYPEIKSTWDKMISDDRYKSLDDEGKMKALRDAAENITTARKAEYSAENKLGKFADNYTGKETKLSYQQKNVLKGSSVDFLTKDAKEEDFNKTPDAEYNAFKDEYNQKIKDGSYSKAQRIKADYTLSKLKVGSNFSKDSRDLYNVSEKALSSWLATEEKGVDKQKLANELIAYDQALYNAGLIKYKKFKGGVATGRNGKGGSRKGGGKSKIDIAQILSKSNLQVQHSQNLSKLLAGTTFKGTKTKPSTSKNKSKVAQKTIKVDMRA